MTKLRVGRCLLLGALACLASASCSSSGSVKYVGTGDVETDGDGEAVFQDALPDGPGDMKPRGNEDGSGPDDGVPDVSEDAAGCGPGRPGCDAVDELSAPDMAGESDGAEISDLPPETVQPEPVFETEMVEENGCAPFAACRLYSVSHPGLTAEKFVEQTAQKDPKISALFGGQTKPGADRLVLHVGTGCGKGDKPQSGVMLVHGAGSNAMQSFVEPSLLGTGMYQALTSAGLCVFAVSFPHPFGSNFNQAIELAAAMEQARLLTGLERLDVVGHSKGGIVAVVLASGFGEGVGLDFQQDVDRLVLIGAPLGGTDFSFRHPLFNFPAEYLQLSMPSSWDKVLEGFVWKDTYADSIYGGAFNGVLQLQAAWDEVFPLSVLEQDWYTTYYGGQGFVSHSLGIAAAIDLGSNFLAKMKTHEVPPGIPAYLVSGGNPIVNGLAWEATGPSDGMVFRKSAEDASILPGLVETKHFALLNHWDLVSSSSVQEWVAGKLAD